MLHQLKLTNYNATTKIVKQSGFTPCKTEQPLRRMELEEKEAQKRLQHTGNLFRKNLHLKDVY